MFEMLPYICSMDNILSIPYTEKNPFIMEFSMKGVLQLVVITIAVGILLGVVSKLAYKAT